MRRQLKNLTGVPPHHLQAYDQMASDHQQQQGCVPNVALNRAYSTQKKTSTLLRAMLINLGYNEIYIDFKEDKLITEIIETE